VGAVKTDWDAYYRRPGSLTGVTRRITSRVLLRCLASYRGDSRRARVLEFGGANSCFFDEIRSRLQPVAYTIVDNNRAGLELFEREHAGIDGVTLREADVRELPPSGADEPHDICFSVGLIEHFDPAGTRAAVAAHFRWVRPGGLVVLLFPTPTWLYRSIRRTAERCGIWAFPDERPLRIDEDREAVADFGRPIASGVNWWIGLTQAYLVVEVAD
jgi:hypothetical protein